MFWSTLAEELVTVVVGSVLAVVAVEGLVVAVMLGDMIGIS
jgi:hypothetical protein